MVKRGDGTGSGSGGGGFVESSYQAVQSRLRRADLQPQPTVPLHSQRGITWTTLSGLVAYPEEAS